MKKMVIKMAPFKTSSAEGYRHADKLERFFEEIHPDDIININTFTIENATRTGSDIVTYIFFKEEIEGFYEMRLSTN